MDEVALVALGGGIAIGGSLVTALVNGEIQRRHDSRSDQRSVIDAGLEASSSCMEAATVMWGIYGRPGSLLKQGASEDYLSAREEFVSGTRSLNVALSKMSARLGQKHELTAALDACRQTYGRLIETFPNEYVPRGSGSFYNHTSNHQDRIEIKTMIGMGEDALKRLEFAASKNLT